MSFYKPLSLYYLANISNQMNDPLTAYDLYYAMLNMCPDFFKINSIKEYIFKGIKEEYELPGCPLCCKSKEECAPYWCYPMPTVVSYHQSFNPIRLWLHCSDCEHLFASCYPKNINVYDLDERKINTSLFDMYEKILSNITVHLKTENPSGILNLLEVGVGKSECIFTAKKMGFKVFGLDITENHVKYARENLGLDVILQDFTTYESTQKWK